MPTQVQADRRSGIGYADAEDDTDNPTLEKLVSDTQSTALLTSTIASIFNALIEPGVARTRTELQSYLPSTAGLTVGLADLDRCAGAIGCRLRSHSGSFFQSGGSASRDRSLFRRH